MTYLIPTVYKTILLIFCLSLVLQTLSRFFKIKETLDMLGKADSELMACAQRQANLLNIEDAYIYLKIRMPTLSKELEQLRSKLAYPFLQHENECTHALFKTIQASTKQQNNRAKDLRWPNWVFAMRENIP